MISRKEMTAIAVPGGSSNNLDQWVGGTEPVPPSIGGLGERIQTQIQQRHPFQD
ncbi:MAG: hypothetical protein VKJ46_06875 [Leptolyngbyaceae bacterium]|nr:hypothetical protein [Leptolyngbyaceae bacterium]